MIRNLKSSDIPEIEFIYENSNKKVNLPLDDNFYEIDKKKFIKITLNNSKNLVYDLCGKPVGIISFSNDFIEGLFVNPAFQCRGIGSLLLKNVTENIKNIRLHVYKDNLNAVKFYKKHGFSVAETGFCYVSNLPYYVMEHSEIS